MIQLFKKNIRQIARHAIAWIVLYALLIIMQTTASDHNDYNGIAQTTASVLASIVIIYTNIFLCNKFFFSRRIFYFSGILLLYIIYFVLVYVDIKDTTQVNPITGKQATNFTIGFFFTLYFLVLVLLSFVYWAVKMANKKNKELLASQYQLREFEKDKNEAEKKFLQSQINPHFLYNTLNYFYSKSLSLSPELADSILLLSDIMHYSLELKENEYGMVPLSDEVRHIKNIIRINQYRFSNKLQIQFLQSGSIDTVSIAPLILITFVENAFKHAELLDNRNPLLIKLDISSGTQQIYFIISNKKKKGPKEYGTGIGIENARRRLDFIYAKNYSLEIKEDEEFYNASITLPLYKDNTA